jgi:tetratricopeptide (TPR) repeat protein
MAIVYLAHDVRHERDVAVKVLRPELAASVGADRFLREIKLAAKLTHQNILALYDSGEADGFLYYVMPYVDGESLRHKLNRERQLAIDEALRLTQEIAEGLDYAHEQGIIHRDIKPENILLSRGHALIADFGIAKAISEAGSERLTETGMGVGTPAYMSPEQAGAEKQIDGRSDLYSLGCMVYEMLAGEPPFSGPTAQAIIAKQLGQPPPSARVARETVTPTLDAVVRRALAKVPADRFDTVVEFASALDQAVDRWRQLKRRVAPPAAVAAAAALALAVFGLPGDNGNGEENSAILATVQVSVLPVVARDGAADTSRQAQRVRRLFASELARYRGLEVVDPLSLNDGATQDRTAGAGALQYVVRLTATPAPGALEVAYALTDAADGTIVESGAFSNTDDTRLPTQVRQASGRLAVALEAVTGGLAKGLDVEPFLTRASNEEAVEAFLRGVEYSYRFIPGGREHFERAVELDPDFIGPRVFLASGLVAIGENAAAAEHVAVLQSLKASATPFEQAGIGWAEAAVRGDVEGQIRHLRVSLAYAPHNNIVLFDLAANLWGLGRVEEALEPAREAMESGWPFAPLYALWGRLAIETGALEGLRDTLAFALTFDTSDPFLTGLLEALALCDADTTAAERYGAAFRGQFGASNAAAGYAQLTDTYRTLARRACDRGDPGTAVLLLQRLVDAGVALPIVRLELARALAESGDRPGAESYYLDVAGAEQDDPEVLYVAGAVAEQLGRPQDARDHYGRYLEVAPNGPDAIRVRERLRVLGRPGPS